MKKHHKVHRHKESSHKRSSKSKSRHKNKKDQPLNENVLEPIQEVSKEKLKVDRNACGDNVTPLVVPSLIEDDQRKKSKRRREKDDKTGKVDKLGEEEINIFAKNYLQKLRESTDETLVKNNSLKKNEDGFINKTKHLFKKEKSFKDTVPKVSDDLEISKEHRKEKKHRHRSEKDEKSDKIKKKEEKHKNHEKSSKKRDKDSKEDKSQDNGEKHKTSAKKKVKSKEKLPTDVKETYNRVQEVIYCQLDPVPFKLKNDKSVSEIKDLYQRIKREKSRDKKGDRTKRDKSYDDDKKKHHLEKNLSYHSHHISGKVHTKEEKKKSRSKSRSKREYEDIQKVEAKAETHSKNHKCKDRNHRHHHDHSALLEDSPKNSVACNMDLGPYHKYFAIEKKYAIEHYHNKHHERVKEESSREKKQREKQEQIIYSVDYDHRHCKKHHDRHEGKTEALNENKHKTDEDKIHQLMEGDLKNYFTKMQHMIDQKLDAIISINKSKHEKTSKTMLKDREIRKRSKSRAKDDRSKKEERSNNKKDDSSKHNRPEDKDNLVKEEIIQEVLKRIKKEVKKSPSLHREEKVSLSKVEKQVDSKHKSKAMPNEISKSDRKHRSSSKIRQDISSDRKLEESKNKIHHDSVRDLRQIEHSSRKHVSRKQPYEEVEKLQEKQSSEHRNDVKLFDEDKKNSRHSRLPDNISKSNDLKDPQDISSTRKSLDKQRHTHKSAPFPKDSLVYMQHRTSSPTELVTPLDDRKGIDRETYIEPKRRHKSPHKGVNSGKGGLSSHSLRKHYTSASSCRASSEHRFVESVSQKSEQVVTHQYSQSHVVSNAITRERYHLDKRRKVTPETRPQEISHACQEKSHIFCSKYDGMPKPALETHSPLEHLVPTHPKDYIMAPREPRKSKHRIKNCSVLDHCPVGHLSRHDVVLEYTANTLEKIILPPEMFRTPERIVNPRELMRYKELLVSPERQHPKPEFAVQGIEPPILECSKQNSTGRPRTRNLECKTVSIVGIPPQIKVKDLSMVNQTDTCIKSQKSTTPDRDLVEKRKHSKRFRLYYKYSIVNNNREADSGSSDAKSIVSDSFRVISDPSDEDREGDVKAKKEQYLTPDLLQTLSVAQKKWNRLATPRDSHLNNIVEEPSNMSNSIKNKDYFIPMRGTNECYFRALTSSHSEYCFKINKKPANSNISIVSKDTCDGRYRFYEDGRCRYCKHDVRSKSDFNMMVSNCSGIHIFRSKSDVFLGGASGKKVIKSIFLEDSHPYVKSRPKPVVKQNPALPNICKNNKPIKATCKDCQTSDVKVNYDFVPVEEEETTLEFEDKQRQFKDIYKTIDDLEENIHSSRRAPPQTLDVAVSSRFMSLDEISDKKTQFKEIYNTIDALQSKMTHPSNIELVKTIDSTAPKSQRSSRSEPRKNAHDMAVGDRKAPARAYKGQRNSRSEPRRNTHEVAVGDNTVVVPVKTFSNESVGSGKRLKSTGVSPIRVVEDHKHFSKSPTTKNVSPQTRSYATRPSAQRPFKNIPDDSALKKTTPRIAETKRESSSLKPKLILVKNTKGKSPERTQTTRGDRRNLKPADIFHPAIRVLRSEEKSTHLKKRETVAPSRSKDRDGETKTTTEKTQTPQKEEAVPKATCIFVNVSEDGKPVITVPTNTTKIPSRVSVRKYTPKDKGDIPKKPCPNREVDLPNSCVHHYHPKDVNVRGSSKSIAKSGRTPAGTPNTPITVNTALYKGRPAIHTGHIPCDKSTSSSVDDSSAHHMRRSRSLMEIRNQRNDVNRSQSEIINVDGALAICNSRDFEVNGGSVISGTLEKFSNVPRLRCQSSKSNVHSLDQFITHKFTSRLLLTKDYKGGDVSAYQKRKLYDQSIRQKMKKKFRFSKLDVGPQIYEVRFLSMAGQENVQRKGNARMKHYLDRPLITLNLEKVKAESSLYQTGKRNSHIPKYNDKMLEATETIIANDSIVKREELVDKKSADSFVLKKFLKANDDEQSALAVQKEEDNNHNIITVNIQNRIAKSECNSVTQLYFNDNKINENKLLSFCNKLLEVNSSLVFPEEFKGAQCDCSKYSKNCQSCKHFVHLMDMLCTSVASYCDSKTKLINVKLEDDTLNSSDQFEHDDENISTVDKLDVKDEPHSLNVHFPNLEIKEASNDVQEIYSRSGNILSGESTDQGDRIFRNLVESVSLATTSRTDRDSTMSQPLSCPILPTNTSSFEFLYEETTSTDNESNSREVMLANLTRPFDRTFNLSLSQYNVETPFFQRNSHFSGTGSSESGYDSVNSKSLKENSLTNFFKKSNIATFLKPPALTKRKSELSKYCEQNGHGDFKKSILYDEMTKSCKLYAKKVRESSDMKVTENIDEYQEFSLALLLGKNSTVILESTALRQESSTHITTASSEDAESHIGKLTESKANEENDEFSDVGDDFSKSNEIPFVENGCKLVLSNERLRIDSFTYLGPEIFNEEYSDLKFKISKESENRWTDDSSKKDDHNASVNDDDSSFTLDSNNPFLPSRDALTKKFFGSLLKVYEKEIELCNELFKNDDFLNDILLPAVKKRKNDEKRTKKGRFSRFFKKKLPVHQTSPDENKSEQTKNLEVKALVRLQSLASNAKKCFSMFADAVKINENIDDEIKICGLLKLLERIESGDFHMIKNEVDSNIERDIKSQVTEAFISIYEICEKEAKNAKRSIGHQEINLITGFISKYRIGLLSKTDIVAAYIGRGVIQTEAQLKAAVTYLMRSQSNKINVEEFEEFCNLTKSYEK